MRMKSRGGRFRPAKRRYVPVVDRSTSRVGRPKTRKINLDSSPGSSLCESSWVRSSAGDSTQQGLQGQGEGDGDWAKSEAGEGTAHSARKTADEDRWSSLRPKLLLARLAALCPTQKCSHCQGTQEEIIRCLDCGPAVFLCDACSAELHGTLMFHRPYIWKENRMYCPAVTKPHLRQATRHICSDVKTENIVVFDKHGVSHDVMLDTCCHEDITITMLHHGLWPATPCSPKTAFSLELLELCVCFQLYGCLSIQAFAKSLQEVDNLMGVQLAAATKPGLYRNLLGAINEYRYHRSQINREKKLSNFEVTSCDICAKDKSRCIFSLDGNFALVHKQRGELAQKSRHTTAFFIPDDNVQEFTQKWLADKRRVDTDCSQFQAGNTIRSKNKTDKLDVTGVFGSICQHEFPGPMLNMTQGESMAYPAMLLSMFEGKSHKQQLVMYDIGCQLHKHLRLRMSDLVHQFRFSVPAFHRFAHTMTCQLTYGQRCTVGAALNDGEGMERLWSYLRKFAPATKQMALSSLEDLLTDALFAYSQKSFLGLGQKLCRQVATADSLKKKSQAECVVLEEELKRNLPGASGDWLATWQRAASSQNMHQGTEKPTAREELAFTIMQLAEKKALSQKDNPPRAEGKLSEDIQKLEVQAEKLKKRCQLQELPDIANPTTLREGAAAKVKLHRAALSAALNLAKERQFLDHLMKKYADGQAVAARIGLRVKTNSQLLAKVEATLASYGIKVDSKELKNIDSPVYSQVHTTDLIPSQKKAALAKADYDRACEAETETRKDMTLFLQSLAEKQKALNKLIEHIPETPEETGERHLLCTRQVLFEKVHEVCATDFARHIDIDETLAYVPSRLMRMVEDNLHEPCFDLHIELEDLELEIPDSEDELE
ncbi:hypothetical protein V1264_006006 [Littorina saxatilis]